MENRTEEQKKLVVIHHSKQNKCEDVCEKVLTEYAEHFQKKFELFVPHGHFRSPQKKQKEDAIYVYVWSTPVSSMRTKIEKTYGYELDSNTGCALLPSEEGIVICDEEGQELAEVVGKGIYVLFDLVHIRKEYVEPILRTILDKALFWIFEADEESRKNYNQEKQAKAKDRFVRIYGDFEYSLKLSKEELNKANKQIEKCQESLTQWIKHARARGESLNLLEKWRDRDTEFLFREWESLYGIPKVKEVKVYSDRLSVFTEMICIKYKNLVLEIGEFKADVNQRGKGIKLWNLTHPELDKNCKLQHPHVSKDGMPCFGNIQEAFPPLVAECKFSALAALIIQYLESLNLEDKRARKKFFYWPFLGETEEEREKRVRAFEERLKQERSPKLEEDPVPLFDELHCSSEVKDAPACTA